MKQVFLLLYIAAQPPGTPEDPARPLKDVLTAQVKAWNDGDIDGYMSHYWKSERLTFSSGGQTTRGWEMTHERYRKRYPTRDDMGTLTFSDLEVTFLGEEAAMMLGRWRLERKMDAPQGNFSLVFRKIESKWVIIHDHTSLTPEKPKGADPRPANP
jgi:beta-aspartyl-peptidase (threonine type)